MSYVIAMSLTFSFLTSIHIRASNSSYRSLSSYISIMRVYSRLLATATDAGASRPFRPAPMALLPPIPLYRRLLRTHRKKLQAEERILGDLYVKAEFRAHRDVENPVQIVSFCAELGAERVEGIWG